MWWKGDDGWWSNDKLQDAGRSGRGLLADLLSYTADKGLDGFIPTDRLNKLDCSTTDPDLKKLVKVRMLHRRGDTCRCLDKRAWTWPDRRGYVIHDYLDYNPSKEENDVVKAQRAELRDPALRSEVRARDFGRCRYCGTQTNPNDRRWDSGETLDHIDPAIAAGAANLVIACRACNSAKKKRTPQQAAMSLYDVADVRALHFAGLGIDDPDEINNSQNPGNVGPRPSHVPGRVQDTQADAPGRGRDGSDRVGTGQAAQIGPPTTIRDSQTPNPYLRSAYTDPSLDPPPPRPPPAQNVQTSPHANPRSQRPRKRKGRR